MSGVRGLRVDTESFRERCLLFRSDDFFWSDRSRSLVFPVDGVRSLSLRKDWEITSVRLKHKSSSWESFCFDVFVVGGLTSVLMADDRLLINVLIGTRVVPFGVLRRVGS